MSGATNRRFVRAAWTLLAFQLFAGAGATGIAIWAALKVQQLIDQRDLLQERVTQLEAHQQAPAPEPMPESMSTPPPPPEIAVPNLVPDNRLTPVPVRPALPREVRPHDSAQRPPANPPVPDATPLPPAPPEPGPAKPPAYPPRPRPPVSIPPHLTFPLRPVHPLPRPPGAVVRPATTAPRLDPGRVRRPASNPPAANVPK